MIETIQPQPAKMPWERAAPTHSSPMPALSPSPNVVSRLSPIRQVDITLGRRQLLEIGMEQSWEFGSLPSETIAALRAGILEPQEAAVQRGRGSVVSLAALLLQCGDVEGARSALDRAPNKADYWTEHMRAMTFWQGGDLAVAEDILRALSNRDAQDPRPLHVLGKLLCEQDRFTDAAALLRSACLLDPESPPLLNDLGAVLIASQQPQEGLRTLRVALRIAPTYALALANSGVAHYQLKHKMKAVDFFRRALVANDHCVVAVHNLAECLLERCEWDTAGDLLRKYIDQSPHDARAHELLAWAHLSSGRIRDAQKVLEQGLKLRGHGDSGLLNNLATVYASLQELPKAQAAFQSAILLAPENSLIRANFAHFLATHHAWPRVIEVLRPSDVDGVSDRAALLGRALLETGALEDAVLILRSARIRFPAEPRFVLMLGHALASRLGNPEAAIEVYRDALTTHDDDLLKNNLSYALILAGRFEEARTILNPIYFRMRDSNDTTALCAIASYGLLHIGEGDYKEGIALYREAHSRAIGAMKQRIKQKMLVEEGRQHFKLGNVAKARSVLKVAAAGHDVEFRAQAEQVLASTLD